MEKALENPHFKKIWEKVIRNRHPEEKTLEGALDMETKNDSCIVKFNDCLFTSNNVLGIKSAIIALRMANLSDAKVQDVIGDENNFQVLGRPIALEDILQLKLNAEKFPKWSKEHIENGVLVYINHMIVLGLPSGSTYINLDDSVNGYCFCTDWQLTKPLHEQTEVVWEQIAAFI